MKFAFGLLNLCGAAACLWLALDWRSPFLASVRLVALAGLIALPLALGLLELWLLRGWRRQSPAVVAVHGLALLVALATAGTTAWREARFHFIRHQVLQAEPAQLQRLGRHLVIGYRDPAVLRHLVTRGAVAGVFITARNVRGRSAAQFGAEITALQAIRTQQGLPPLWIATDQEGGPVSRLSPPFSRLPPLQEIVRRHPDQSARAAAVRAYATTQGRELASIGVNLNFAPVVDLDHGVVNPADRHTRIGLRAIASDPAVVLDVATQYCSALHATGVRCTLKHFPGLGRVFEDTHLEAATLTAHPNALEATDWVPFRGLLQHPGAFIMLSHVRLTAIDPMRPASLSTPVVTGLLRQQWNYGGILVTDDFSMGAIVWSADGIEGGSVQALNAGVDLILVSYDPDQYYFVMHALLQADRKGLLRGSALEQSNARLGLASR